MGLDSTPLTASSTFTSPLYPPLAGTNVQAANVADGEQVLLNRTERLKDIRIREHHFEYVDDAGTSDPGVAEAIGTSATAFAKSANIKVDIASCVVGDVLLCSLHMGGLQFYNVAALVGLIYRLYATDDFGGGGAVDIIVPGSQGRTEFDLSIIGNSSFVPCDTQGRHTVTVAGTTRIGLSRRTTNSSGKVDIYQGIHLQVLRLRAP